MVFCTSLTTAMAEYKCFKGQSLICVKAGFVIQASPSLVYIIVMIQLNFLICVETCMCIILHAHCK